MHAFLRNIHSEVTDWFCMGLTSHPQSPLQSSYPRASSPLQTTPDIDPLDLPPLPESPTPPDPPLLGAGYKWLYGAIALAVVIAEFATLRAKELSISPGDLAALHLLSFWVLPAAGLLVGALWLIAAWGELTPDRRGGVSPLMAGALLLVPVWGFSWLYEVHQRLCQGIEHTLTELGQDKRAPEGLATVASFTFIGLFAAYLLYPEKTFLPFVVNSAAWFVYMSECDAARAALKAAQARRARER
jgi:hypothetical protein